MKLLGARILDHNLWHLHRRSAAGGVFIGIFAAFIPLPIQTLVVAVLCVFTRSNLPVGFVFTWVSNPVTYIPLYYFCYRVGNLVLGLPVNVHMDAFTVDQFTNTLEAIWKPLFVGCFVTGIAVASVGYVAAQTLWRYHVLKQWRKRKRHGSQSATACTQAAQSANDEQLTMLNIPSDDNPPKSPTQPLDGSAGGGSDWNNDTPR